MNDELRRAISIAQTAHDRNDGPADNTAVAIGALIRVVTILAGEQQTSRDEAINVYKETRDAAVRAFGEGATENSGIVASMEQKIKMQHARIGELEEQDHRAGELLVKTHAAHAAAEARVSDLEKLLAEQGARESRLHVVLSDHGLPTEPKALARELTQRSAPMTVDGKTPGEVCFAAFDPNLAQFGSRVLEDWERAARAVLAAFGDNAIARSAQDCMPGDVLYEAHKFVDDNFPDESNAKRYNMAALAVLRAFGQPRQTARANAVDALRDCLERVRERLGEEERGFGGEHLVVPRPMWMAIIDDELAKLGQASPTSEQVHNVVPVQIGVVTKGRRMCMACAGWGHDGASAYRGATCGACKGTGCQ